MVYVTLFLAFEKLTIYLRKELKYQHKQKPIVELGHTWQRAEERNYNQGIRDAESPISICVVPAASITRCWNTDSENGAKDLLPLTMTGPGYYFTGNSILNNK